MPEREMHILTGEECEALQRGTATPAPPPLGARARGALTGSSDVIVNTLMKFLMKAHQNFSSLSLPKCSVKMKRNLVSSSTSYLLSYCK